MLTVGTDRDDVERLTGGLLAYQTCPAEVQPAVHSDLKALLDCEPRARTVAGVTLHLNTKDIPGRGYLAPVGTSLGEGDCGVVGRGNRYSGAIEPLRPASCEAPAGKNPVHHVGKIHTAVAAETARQVMAGDVDVRRGDDRRPNGGPLGDPALVTRPISVPLMSTAGRRPEASVLAAMAARHSGSERSRSGSSR